MKYIVLMFGLMFLFGCAEKKCDWDKQSREELGVIKNVQYLQGGHHHFPETIMIFEDGNTLPFRGILPVRIGYLAFRQKDSCGEVFVCPSEKACYKEYR